MKYGQFLPGAKVVCVNDDPKAYCLPYRVYTGDLDGLKKGQIYTINTVFEDPKNKTICVYLNEIKRPIRGCVDYEMGYRIDRFRLLRSQSGFKTLEHIVRNPDMYKTIYVEYSDEKTTG